MCLAASPRRGAAATLRRLALLAVLGGITLWPRPAWATIDGHLDTRAYVPGQPSTVSFVGTVTPDGPSWALQAALVFVRFDPAKVTISNFQANSAIGWSSYGSNTDHNADGWACAIFINNSGDYGQTADGTICTFTVTPANGQVDVNDCATLRLSGNDAQLCDQDFYTTLPSDPCSGRNYPIDDNPGDPSEGDGSSSLFASGDVNGDGQLTAQDAILTLRIAGGLYNPSLAEFLRADVQPTPLDGKVTILDAIAEAQWAFGSGIRPIPSGALLPMSLDIGPGQTPPADWTFTTGYTIRGRVRAPSYRLPGQVAYYNPSTYELYGPSGNGSTGRYSLNVPAGTYQPLAVGTEETTNEAGENTSITETFAGGNSLVVNTDLYGQDITVPAPGTRSTFTLNLGGALSFLWMPQSIYMAGYYANYVQQDMFDTSCTINVPEDWYTIYGYGRFYMGDGYAEDVVLTNNDPVDVTHSTTFTLNVPGMTEVSAYQDGRVYAAGLDAMRPPYPTGITAAVSRWQNGSGVRLAAPEGNYIFWQAVATPYPETYAEYQVTMPYFPTSWSSWSMNSYLPPLPTFRTITGRLLTPAGVPVTGAMVTATSIMPDPYQTYYEDWFVYDETMTDAFGRYTLHIPDGSFHVTAQPGF